MVLCSTKFNRLISSAFQRATSEELDLIKSHLSTKPEVPLDKPEQFLHDLSEISNFADRISCLMFQVEFDDSISTIGHILTNIKSTCEVPTCLHFPLEPFLR